MPALRELSIRHATSADVAAIAEIHLAAWDATYAETPLRDHLARRAAAERESIWTRCLDRHSEGVRLWVASRAGPSPDQLLGFLATGPVRHAGQAADDATELYALYQRPTAARTGVAHRLVGHALAELRARAFRVIHLWALASNREARAFYERQGFHFAADVPMTYAEAPLPHVRYQLLL